MVDVEVEMAKFGMTSGVLDVVVVVVVFVVVVVVGCWFMAHKKKLTLQT